MSAQRTADAAIVDELRREDFDPECEGWQALSDALIEYGYAVLVAWGVSGCLRERAVAGGVRGVGRLPEVLQLDEDEARSLADEVLLVAIEAFRTKSLPKWNPCGGASLTTFFIRRCLMELPDVYTRWYASEVEPLPMDPFGTVDDGRHGAFPAEEVEARVLLDELLADDPVLREAFQLQQHGYSLDEIAQLLGTTAPALSSRMYRLRRTARGASDD